MSLSTFYSLYKQLSEDNIKRNCSPQDFDQFMMRKSIDYPFEPCMCSIPEKLEYEPDSDLIKKACIGAEIEMSKCIQMININKLENIDRNIAEKLTSLCNNHCSKLNDELRIREYKEKVKQKEKFIKDILRQELN